jgi:hypothetical protein
MQLRLVEGPSPDPATYRARRTGTAAAPNGTDRRTGKGRQPAQARGAKGTGTGRPVRGTVRSARGRAVHWADWQLDARTRRVGRAGVAAAKAALEQAARPEPGTPLSKAS